MRMKWALFWLLETAASMRSGPPIPPVANPAPPASHANGSLWVYVSTIGELNAIEPFLRMLLEETGRPPLTLISDRRTYRESFAAKYPEAYIYEIDGSSADAARLTALAPPKLLVIAEIPCLLSDAPCRLPFALVRELKRRRVPVCAVNGWLYGYAPPSRLDAIERRLFGREYVASMDLITVQTDEIRQTLIRGGASPARVHVTGNTKFDAVTFSDWSPQGARSEALLRSLVQSGRPRVVAGCVTDIKDQEMILDAFLRTRVDTPAAMLVLVPRHPESKERMATLEVMLQRRNLAYAFRTRIPDAPLSGTIDVLVVDTMGELKDFYATATVTFVGRNHNILEALTFGKPVTVSGGWEPTFPSFPVYTLLKSVGAIHEIVGADELGARWSAWTRHGMRNERALAEARASVKRLSGAARRNMELLATTVRTWNLRPV
jgi:3-deoxy-D-manno-octulosonic-acid transferase